MLLEALRAELRWACKRSVPELEIIFRGDLDKPYPVPDEVCVCVRVCVCACVCICVCTWHVRVGECSSEGLGVVQWSANIWNKV
jgi:hypothetical protein